MKTPMFSQNVDMEYLKENETKEDLETGGYMLLQKKDGFRFGVDAVLLADFAKDIKADTALDLCTGSAIVPILLSAKTKIGTICALEIQEEIAEMAERSVRMNGLEKRIKITREDLKNAEKIYKKRSFSLITCNPPYMPKDAGVKNENDSKIIARHEVMCELSDVISVSAKLLSQKGHIVLVHKPTRLVDIICLMRENEIEPKRLRFVHKKVGAPPSLVLVDGAYKGGKELSVLPPLYIYDENGNETEEVRRIYGR